MCWVKTLKGVAAMKSDWVPANPDTWVARNGIHGQVVDQWQGCNPETNEMVIRDFAHPERYWLLSSRVTYPYAQRVCRRGEAPMRGVKTAPPERS